MNSDDPFEQKLATLKPRELPPEWRAEILGRAVAMVPARVKTKRPPKWLVAGWGLGWAAVITLHFLTPEPEPASQLQTAAVREVVSPPHRSQTLYALLNSHLDLNP
jgi:hypothetical protein